MVVKLLYNGKSFFLLFFIILISFSSVSQTKTKEIITLKGEVIGLHYEVNDTTNNVFYKNYYLRISITNNQDTSIYFFVSNCHWDMGFLTDNDSMTIFPTHIGCEIDVEEKITLLPKQKVIFYGSITGYNKVEDSQFRLGFVMLNLGELPPYSTYSKKSIKAFLKTKKIYWSEDIFSKTISLHIL